jgi:AcrR family transcriptional regulator
MAAAGLTSGAFYSHFRSKSELLEAVVDGELKRSIGLFSNTSLAQALAAVESYLSPSHVSHPESGCVVPALAPEIARASGSTKRSFEQGVLGLKDQIRKRVDSDAQAWSILSQLVGAVMVARGLPSEKQQKALLKGVNQQVNEILERTPAAT